MAVSRDREAPRVPRSKWLVYLHRAPARWDVLLHKLAEAIARRYWHTQAHFRQQVLRLESDELWDAAICMSRAFGQQTSYAGVAKLAGEGKPSVFTLEQDLNQVVRDGSATALNALFNYVEIAHNCLLKRDHQDLDLLAPRIEETFRRFLQDKCMGGGALQPCLEMPMAPDEGYFPASNRVGGWEAPAGNAALDAYRLNVLVHDGDDAVGMMRKLIEFARTDPFVAPEFAVEMVTRLAVRKLNVTTQDKQKDATESVLVRDRFLFSPSRQGGSEPVRVFAGQQLLASDRQKERLARWCDENVNGVFTIRRPGATQVIAEDIANGRRYELVHDPLLDRHADGAMLRMRILPWDEQWIISGAAQGTGDENIQKLRDLLHPLRVRRQVDNDDPRLQSARRLVREIHRRFAERFGGDLAQFETLAACRAALAEFHHGLVVEARLVDGRQLADTWREEVGMDFPSFYEDRFAGEDEVSQPGVLYDTDRGMAFLPDAVDVQYAMTSPFPTPQQKKAFARLVLEKWRPGWVVRRLVDEHPERGQELLREMLGRPTFSAHADLDALLGRVKCPDYTLPARPIPFLEQ